jgi:hypothetical protein
VVVGEVRAHVERVVPDSLPVPDADAVVALVRRVAESVPGGPAIATPPPANAAPLRLSVELEVGWASRGPLRSVVRVHLAPVGEGSGAARVDRDGLVEKEGLSGPPTSEAVRAHLEHALGLVVGAAMRGEQLWLGPPALARAAITGSDEELRDEGMRVAAERRDREAVPLILPLLKQEDAELRDRAIGALADIGDPRAAHALAELAKFGDVQELMKIIDAISRVGGPEAQSYLELVVGGHPSAEVRAIAQRALDHMKKRGADLSGMAMP